jgi:hypothetical protein
MQKCEDNVATRLNGNTLQPLSGVQVVVTADLTGLPAALYSDNGVTPLPQPLVTDDNGYYGFYAANGEYTLTFSSSRIATFTRKVVLADPSDNPYATLTQVAAPSGASIIGYTRATDGAVMSVANALDTATTLNDTAVRGALLTGLSTATNAVLVVTDTMIGALGKLQRQISDWLAAKDAANGHVGLTGFAINFKNAANTFTSLISNTNTAARAYFFPDKDGTVAMLSDITCALLSTDVIGAAAANIDRLTLFSSTYDKYVIELEGILPSTNALDTLNLRFANAGTVDVGASNYGSMAGNSGTPANAAFIVLTSAAVANTVTSAVTMTVEVRNANSATTYKSVGLRGFYNTIVSILEGSYKGGIASGFRLYWSAGANFTAGTVRVYGYRNT